MGQPCLARRLPLPLEPHALRGFLRNLELLNNMSAVTNSPKKRSLILAGGGVKVAFQAGVLEVWLDEAGLTFDHADGASGGVFNLAMLAQGMSGREIADNWRNLDPNRGIALNWTENTKLFYGRSLFTLDAYRRNVFSAWRLDWRKIRASSLDATFNTYNFSKHELEVIQPARMTEDFLVAAVSLPMWFPPVEINGDLYIDAVYITDANVEEAIRRGADEIWVIWTVRDKGDWHDGFVSTYFQIIETRANGHFKRVVRRIEENNAAISTGGRGEFGRHIDLKILKADVALHYLFNVSQDRLIEAVNNGVQTARAWCHENGIPLKAAGQVYATEVHTALTRLQFSEEMKGYVALGEIDFEAGFRAGRKTGSFLAARLTIKIDGVNRFVTEPSHEAIVEGTIECDALGGTLVVEHGTFNLLVDQEDTAKKRMLYRLVFQDGNAETLTLSGFKEIRDDPGMDIWEDTTTLYVRVFRGSVRSEDEATAEVVAAGIIRIHFLDFLEELASYRVQGPTQADRSAAMARFGQLFLGRLWDVYAREILTSSPF
jgi:predicted patatin/cPLA2 family phospholipase